MKTIAALVFGIAAQLASAAESPVSAELEAWEFRRGADVLPDKLATWRVEGAEIHCSGTPTGYLATRIEWQDYTLELEWRWPVDAPADANSGVLLHAIPNQRGLNAWPLCYEVQLQRGKAGQIYALGRNLAFATTSPARKFMGVDAIRLDPPLPAEERPAGEWNHLRVTAAAGVVEVAINGRVVARLDEVQPTRGVVALQAEGAPLSFRNLRLQPAATAR